MCSRCLIWSSSRWLDGALRIMEFSSWASKSTMHYFIIKGAPCSHANKACRGKIWKRMCLKLTLSFSRQFPSRQLIYLLFSQAFWHFHPSARISRAKPQKTCAESWIAQSQTAGGREFFSPSTSCTHFKFFVNT